MGLRDGVGTQVAAGGEDTEPVAVRAGTGLRRRTSSLRPPTEWIPAWNRLRPVLSSIAMMFWRVVSLRGTDWWVSVKGLASTTV